MKYILKRTLEKAFLCFKNDVVSEINKEFTLLTGYSCEELIGKSFHEINIILKIDSQTSLKTVDSVCDCYLFTKENAPREVTISLKSVQDDAVKVYYFKEKPNSRIDNKFLYLDQLYKDNQIGAAIYSFPDLIFLHTNEKYLDNYGPYYKKEKAIGKKLKELVSEEEWTNVEKFVFNAANAGRSFYGKEIKYQHIEKGFIYGNTSLIPITDKGKIKYIIHTIQDVTEMVLNRNIIKNQNKAIKAQKEELDLILENISDRIYIVDKDLNISPLTRSAKEFLWELGPCIKVDPDLNHLKCYDCQGKHLKPCELPVTRILMGENIKDYRYTYHTPEGISHISLSGHPIYDKSNNIIKSVICCRDITENVTKEEIIRQHHEKNLLLEAQYDLLNKTIENLEIPYLIISYPDYKIKQFNSKTYNNVASFNQKLASLPTILNEDFFNIYSYNEFEKEEIKNKVNNLALNKENSFFLNRRIQSKEKEFFIKVIFKPIFNVQNELYELVVIAFDITGELQAKAKLEASLRLQDEIFANVSHELKTPLNLIFSTNQLIEFYLKNTSFEENKEKILNNINIIKQNCFRFTKLINNIIDASKIESGFFNLNLLNENIVDVIENIVQSVATYTNEKGLSIVFDTNTEEKIFACDAEKIERAMLNLISNAIKFTNPGGEIIVEFIDKGDTFEIDVKDNGIGMDKMHLRNIFNRFYQIDKSLSRNTEGTGIGLTLVKAIIELHEGSIIAESTLGEGSTFRIIFPSKTINEDEIAIDKISSISNKVEIINTAFSDIY